MRCGMYYDFSTSPLSASTCKINELFYDYQKFAHKLTIKCFKTVAKINDHYVGQKKNYVGRNKNYVGRNCSYDRYQSHVGSKAAEAGIKEKNCEI